LPIRWGWKLSARESKTQRIVVGFGSNIRPAENLPRALQLLKARVPVVALSRVWEGPPVGANGPHFYNAAAVVLAPFSAARLKEAVLRPIEAALGRVRTANPNAPRPIDLDILVEGSQVIDADVWRYAYWAVPVAEIAPGLRHPTTGQPLAAIARKTARTTPLRHVALAAWTLASPPDDERPPHP